MSSHLKPTLIALAVVQAFALPAYAQTVLPDTDQAMAEVVVTGSRQVATDRASVAGFSESSLLQTPASVLAIGRQQMQELNIRNTTDAMKFDASVSDSYNAIGYAEMFSIRGFLLDNASSYRKDGIAISGDTEIALENKERIEVLKGLAGFQAGVATPGGLINYAVKRPTSSALRSAVLEVRERGTIYGALDLGGRFTDHRFGYRFNAATEKLRSYVKGADGERNFISAAFDWQISPHALVQLDMDHQHKSQLTAPGYQLIRGVELPVNVSPSKMLNDQPWARPVETRASNVGLRFEYIINDDWRLTLAANRHSFRRDDFAAFPYGCSNEGAGFYPGFCSNGDYDVYDYQSVGERKNPFGTQSLLQGSLMTGAIKHQLTLGFADLSRSDYFGKYVYDYAGSSNIYNSVAVPPAAGNPSTGPVLEQRRDRERSLIVQDVVSLSPTLTLHAGARHVSVKQTGLKLGRPIDASFVLPNVALAYKPAADWTLYGTLSHGMEYGGIPDFQTANEGIPLTPSRSRQIEFGFKGIVHDSAIVSGALFQIERGKEFYNAANFLVRSGQQTHRGLELAAQGDATPNLRYSVSLTALNMQQEGTGQASIDGKRPENVPAFKSTTVLHYSVPGASGLKLGAAWQYAGKKAFDAANTTFVPGYHVFDLNATYSTRIMGTSVTWRAFVDNVANKFYWRDVTPLLGGYLFPGAPRTGGVSVQVDY